MTDVRSSHDMERTTEVIARRVLRGKVGTPGGHMQNPYEATDRESALFAGWKGGHTPLTGCMHNMYSKILFFPFLTLTTRLTAYHYYVSWGYVHELSC
jgi:hypothetical protein